MPARRSRLSAVLRNAARIRGPYPQCTVPPIFAQHHILDVVQAIFDSSMPRFNAKTRSADATWGAKLVMPCLTSCLVTPLRVQLRVRGEDLPRIGSVYIVGQLCRHADTRISRTFKRPCPFSTRVSSIVQGAGPGRGVGGANSCAMSASTICAHSSRWKKSQRTN